jgi:ribosome biogenesis GTPase
MTFDLTDFGWDERWAAAFAPHAADDLLPARVSIEFNHIYRVITAEGELQAQHSGRLLHRAEGRHELAAVGDWVGIRRGVEQGGTIEVILPRRSKFSRKVAGDLTEEQVVAANIDIVFIVMGLDHDYNLPRLDRYLMTAYDSGATPVVILSKSDLVDDVASRVEETTSRAPGTAVHAMSAKRNQGVDIVHQYLGRGRTGALLGSSGVGKSTLLNALLGSDTLKTAEVRSHDSRGRHTTRHRQLILLPEGGLLIDTPGMRELQLWDNSSQPRETYDEIDTLGEHCHFTNCRHRDEPRCAVKAAVEEGTLSADRLANYHKLQDELAALELRKDARAQIDEKRRAKTINRSLRQLYKDRGRR